MKELIKKLKKTFPLHRITYQRENLVLVETARKNLVPLVTHLKNIEAFCHLNLITVVDFPETDRFQISYLLHNFNRNQGILIRVIINRKRPVMDSIHHLWQQARIYQCEIREMFGIEFPGSPDQERNFILEGWEGLPPLRRDFDTLKYSESTFFPREGRKTHDPRQFMQEKLYPEE